MTLLSLFYFPDDELTIQKCTLSLISSITLVLLGASWLFVFSIILFLNSNNSLNRAVTCFCFFTSSENRSSYLIPPSATSPDLSSCSSTLHVKICCWSSYSELHNTQSRLECKYFCLKFALQSVVLEQRPYRRFTSSLVNNGLSM